jgi:hypothetical protein
MNQVVFSELLSYEILDITGVQVSKLRKFKPGDRSVSEFDLGYSSAGDPEIWGDILLLQAAGFACVAESSA